MPVLLGVLLLTYVSATDAEKRQLIELCFSNMTVQDKKPELPTRNWIVEALDWPVALSCADHDGENRRMSELGSQAIVGIMDTLNSEDLQRFIQICDDVVDRGGQDDLSHIQNKGAYQDVA